MKAIVPGIAMMFLLTADALVACGCGATKSQCEEETLATAVATSEEHGYDLSFTTAESDEWSGVVIASILLFPLVLGFGRLAARRNRLILLTLPRGGSSHGRLASSHQETVFRPVPEAVAVA